MNALILRMVLVNSKHRDGSLRQAAAQRGVQMLLYEGGEALRFDEQAIEAGVQGTLRFMKHIGMIADAPQLDRLHRPAHASASVWLRAPEGGILHAIRKSGDMVQMGDELGIVTDPLGQSTTPIITEESGLFRGICEIPSPLLNDGSYTLSIMIVKDTTNILYYLEEPLNFEIADWREGNGNWYGKWPGVIRPTLPFKLNKIG